MVGSEKGNTYFHGYTDNIFYRQSTSPYSFLPLPPTPEKKTYRLQIIVCWHIIINRN